MKNDVLEMLLLDRAMGEMNDETRELLEAYLVLNPQASRLAAEMDATLVRTRQALKCPPERVRPSSLHSMESVALKVRTRHRTALGLQLAACIAIGLALGFVLRRPSASPETRAVTISAPMEPAESAATEPGAGFWESARQASDKTSIPSRDSHRSRRASDSNR
jgi:hypothetical protein